MTPTSQDYLVTRWQLLTASCWHMEDPQDLESLKEDFWTMNLQYNYSDDFDSYDENIYV
jgi:hypothetical protein